MISSCFKPQGFMSGIAESGEKICRGNPLWLPSTYVRVGTRPTPTVKNHTCIQQRLISILKPKACRTKGIEVSKSYMPTAAGLSRSLKAVFSVQQIKPRTANLQGSALGLNMLIVASRSLESWRSVIATATVAMGCAVI